MPSLESGTRWRLADHARACRVDGQIIVLDMSRSRYIAVGGATGLRLARAIDGWPTSDEETDGRIGAAEADRLVAPLHSQGLVTRGVASGAMATPPCEPLRSLEVERLARSRSHGWRQPARLLRKTVMAALWMRTRSMAGITAGLHTRQIRTRNAKSHLTLTAFEDAVATYLACRPFLFTAHDRCLHDSLTLALYLAGEGVAATWVVGVKTRPFAAHSWVQCGDVVLNDLHEHVRRYRPILVV